MDYYHSTIAASKESSYFRRVVYDTRHLQAVVMSVGVGEEIGEEVHDEQDQLFVFAEGEGKMTIGAEKVAVHSGDVVIIPSGVYHNLRNLGPGPLKLFTCFAPPHYPPGSIMETRGE